MKISVVIVYEDNRTREEAVKFCDSFVSRFWSLHEFDFSWWSVQMLEEQGAARTAGAVAVTAEYLVFALAPGGEPSPSLESWMTTLLERRAACEGAVIGLLDHESNHRIGGSKYSNLRILSHRAGLDYLTEVPAEITLRMSNSTESLNRRAKQVTHVLDEILRRRVIPPAPPA